MLTTPFQSRDCLISGGQGRPRSINLADSDVRPPSLSDFPAPDKNAKLFVAYVEICSIFGDLTESRLRNELSRSKLVSIEARLIRWVKETPEELQLFRQWPHRSLAKYDFEARQLHVPYFTTIAFLYRPSSPNSSLTAVTVLSSSFITGIFEDFLARDELRFLGPIFTFYLLVAGLSQLSCFEDPAFAKISKQELRIVNMSLHELSKKWASAIGPQKVIQGLTPSTGVRSAARSTLSTNLSPEQLTLFDNFGDEICRKWDLVFKPGTSSLTTSRNINRSFDSASNPTGTGSRSNLPTVGPVDNAIRSSQHTPPFEALPSLPTISPPILENLERDMAFDFMSDSVGNWLTRDWYLTDLER